MPSKAMDRVNSVVADNVSKHYYSLTSEEGNDLTDGYDCEYANGTMSALLTRLAGLNLRS